MSGDGKSDLTTGASSNSSVKPAVSLNIESERKAEQQDFVNMYMKSMQEFTDSLAKMKLPMDVGNGTTTSRDSRTTTMANPLYIQILKNGPFTPLVRVEESTDGDMVIPSHYAPKDPSEYTEPEKEKKISAIREGIDWSRITLEVLYGILKIYELEMIQRNSLRDGQGHVVDGSSALIVSENKTSNDEPRLQTPVASTSEQRNNDSKEQVILELEEDEFYCGALQTRVRSLGSTHTP
ncbi:hypothetical protein AgCh_005146 [Apium graveolens]